MFYVPTQIDESYVILPIGSTSFSPRKVGTELKGDYNWAFKNAERLSYAWDKKGEYELYLKCYKELLSLVVGCANDELFTPVAIAKIIRKNFVNDYAGHLDFFCNNGMIERLHLQVDGVRKTFFKVIPTWKLEK